MYTALIYLLAGLALFLFITGLKKGNKKRISFGVIIGIFTFLFFNFLDFYGDLIWFEALGYSRRFWIEISYYTGMALGCAIFGWLLVWLLTIAIPQNKKVTRIAARAVGALAGGIWGISAWTELLKFIHSVSAGISDPVLDKDAGFYMFQLPFLDKLYTLLILLTLISLLASISAAFIQFRGSNLFINNLTLFDEKTRARLTQSLFINSGVFIIVLTFGKFLSRYHLLYSTWGAVMGPGWTDVNIRLPAYDAVIVIMILLAVFIIIPPLRKVMQRFFNRFNISYHRTAPFILGSYAAVIFGLLLLALTVIPGLFQWLRVEPNEITFEKPYIANNIKFTRYAFGLNNIEEKEYPVSGNFTEKTVDRNKNLFNNVRLWDWRALDAVYKQFQEIRLYYEFKDVDIDRYHIDSTYRQVMVSAREMEPSNLPKQSQTFVNTRFKYTHGYGITLATVSDFTDQGLPNLLIKDIPPVSKYPSLNVTRPQIYYGELTDSYVIVNTKEKEFDYPSGEENVYIRYPGKGGVRVSNLWRKFVFGWMFDGTKLFFSSYPTDSSRIMYHRQIEDRVKKLAPFLHFDDDPYVVLSKGKLYWIIDGYTTTNYFPYSEPFSSRERIEYTEGNSKRIMTNIVDRYLNGMNYIRNSVKAVVNAFDGSVDFYIYDDSDPIIKVWDNIYPGLFKNKSEMPAELKAHVRYPADMLLAQGLVYAKYHMSDPTVFYNQEDLWIRATEKYYNRVQPVNPYYVMWNPQGNDEPQFVLILPFTPKNRQVSIGWIAGMCDPQNYGKFLAYKFPKDKRVLGPQQVETKIDQDRFLSGQLTLWDQRGSKVIRGNVLAIPVEKTLFYVEPIYLQAETAAYPELRLVAVMHGDDLSYAESFEKALKGLFSKQEAELPIESAGTEKAVPLDQQIQTANDAFNNYLKMLGSKQFNKAAKELEKLQQALEDLSSRADQQDRIK